MILLCLPLPSPLLFTSSSAVVQVAAVQVLGACSAVTDGRRVLLDAGAWAVRFLSRRHRCAPRCAVSVPRAVSLLWVQTVGERAGRHCVRCPRLL